ncbi:MAG: TetR/AcrR family transcriptional regulator [Chloroflexi bacterium]|nr:TetR/AcrR family transcriptional regulator [Chloroflexota bacterium]
MNTRQHILDATERIIQTKGFARVTTREIAREAGCAEGTLYKHFASKEDLFLAVIQQNLPNVIETVREDRVGTRTISANLEEIALAVINYYEQLIPMTVSFFADTELLARHRAWMHEQGTGPQRLHERVAGYIAAEQYIGRLNEAVNPLNIAILLLGSCFQYAFNRYFMGENPFEMTDQQFVTGLVQTLTEGISPREQ